MLPKEPHESYLMESLSKFKKRVIQVAIIKGVLEYSDGSDGLRSFGRT